MIITNNPYMASFFASAVPYSGNVAGNLGGMAATTTAAAGSSIGGVLSTVASAVPGILKAENAQNLITQEKTAANSLIGLIPIIVIGALGIFLLSASRK